MLACRSRRALRSLCVLGAFIAACNSDDSTANEITALVLSETSLSIGVGASSKLVVYAEVNGASVGPRADAVTWTTSSATIASVDQQGNVRGESLGGPVTITATRAGKTAQAIVLVVPASVEITPRISTLTVGASVQFTATALDHSGAPLVTSPATWSVSFPGGTQVASITSGGRLTILTPGVVVVGASMGGQQGQRDIGVPSAFDGVWSGQSANAASIEFVVQHGVVSSFRLPTTLRQACSRQVLNLQTSAIGTDNRFAISLGSLANLVTGTFTGPASMTGAYNEIPTIDGCAPNTEGAVPASTFSASRQ